MGRDQRLSTDDHLRRQSEIASAGARLVDRFGRPLFVGVSVELHEPLPVVFEITDITPVIDPRQPAGLWTIKLQATVSFPALNGNPIVSLTGVSWPKPGVPAVPETPKPDTPKQDNDTPAGAAEYRPPDTPPNDEGPL